MKRTLTTKPGTEDSDVGKTEKDSSTSSFMATMTFTNPHHTQGFRCEGCDECDYYNQRGSSSGSNIPNAIQAAIKAHKRGKIESGAPMRRTQNRSLVKRKGSISVYQWTLPKAAEPMLEFGQSHRLIWIHRLPKHSVMKSIGKGIIGSSDEEKSRELLDDWKHGNVFLVPSTGGKAVGWIHHEKKSENNDQEAIKENTLTGHAVLYIAKIPKDQVLGVEGEANNGARNEIDAKEWSEIVKAVCTRGLKELEKSRESSSPSFLLSEEDSKLVRDAIL